jgi:hypothetical protein
MRTSLIVAFGALITAAWLFLLGALALRLVNVIV